MKKILIILSFLTLAIISVKAASPYRYLEFKTVDNTSIVVETEGLEITVSGGVLSIANTSGQKMDIDASTLASMQFTDSSASINELSIDAYAEVKAYSLDGTAVGTFKNAGEALRSLPTGIYILRCQDGQTIKIMIGK